MKFGVREICNVVFKAKSDVVIGTKVFKKNQPVLYIDTAKTSNMEQAATTVYAQGGRGNTRLIAWEGSVQTLLPTGPKMQEGLFRNPLLIAGITLT